MSRAKAQSREEEVRRICWLAFERIPHPDAVRCPVDEDAARLVLELLAKPHRERARIAEQLRNYLRVENTLGPLDRRSIPCRTDSGLYRLIEWRLAKWLSHVLPAGDGVIEQTRRRLVGWLEQGSAFSAEGSLPGLITRCKVK